MHAWVSHLCVCKMYNNSTLVFYFTAMQSTGTYPSQYIKRAGFLLSEIYVRFVSDASAQREPRVLGMLTNYTQFHHLRLPPHLWMRQRAPDNHV